MKVGNKILRCSFSGAVIQFTYVLNDDVIEAIASEVSVACLKALYRVGDFQSLKSMPSQHLTKDGIFALVAPLRNYIANQLTLDK